MAALVIQHDFSLLEAFSKRVEAAVAQLASPQALLHSVVDVAHDTKQKLNGLVLFDDEAKTWSFTELGINHMNGLRKSKEHVALLIYGFLFGCYIANDPTLKIYPIAIPENDDDDSGEFGGESSTYYAFYSLLSDTHDQIKNELDTKQLVNHGPDYERLVTDIFGYDVLARQYRQACLQKANISVLSSDLLQAIDVLMQPSCLKQTCYTLFLAFIYQQHCNKWPGAIRAISFGIMCSQTVKERSLLNIC